MPILERLSGRQLPEGSARGRFGAALFPACTNPKCSSNWLHLWRRRQVPVIEGGWACSPECTQAKVEELLYRELTGHNPAPAMHRHRVPIGLVLLAEGWISHEQLKKALEAKRAGAKERLGSWLMKHLGLEEQRLTQALSLQWNCPVFSLEKHGTGPAISLIPRFFLETFGALPLYLSTSGILYLAFEDRMDYSLIHSLERMTGLRVEGGLLSGSEFERAQTRLLQAGFPRVRLIEASSVDSLASAMTRVVERWKPAETRIVRVHDYFWLRMRRQAEGSKVGASPAATEVEDVIGSLAHFQ